MLLNKIFNIFLASCTLLCLTLVQSLSAQSMANIRVLKISPRENAAVVEQSNGQLQLIRIGDSVDGLGRVIAIAPGRIVFDFNNQGAGELVVIRLIGDDQKLERIRKAGDEIPALVAPPDQTAADKSN